VSAGTWGEYPGEPRLVIHHDITLLAPRMQEAVAATLAECARRGLDAIVHETYRDHETAVWYYRRGRTTIPPVGTVTNAPDETWSWHGYKLAADIISATKGWNAGDTWFALMGEIAKRHGLKWGGDWNHPDLPHVQWAKCKASPSDEARRILRESGMEAVWRAVGAA
jgi:peptidoglycan L-alanyl-D-glutamate endopeptidase CwlK